MSGPNPSPAFQAARRVLREEAVSRTERKLRISPELMPALAAVAAEQVLPAIEGIDGRHGGWALVAAGTLVVRNSERLSSAAGEQEPDPSFTGGMAWAALLAAVLGDRLLEAGHRARERPWEPDARALEARRAVGGLLDETDSGHGLAARRFVTYARSELLSGLTGLDRGPAGFALVITAAWIAGNEERIAAPLCHRRGFMRRVVSDVEQARAGCGLAAAVLAGIGEPVIAEAGAPAGG
jgi:hypothetical protein